MKPTGSDVVTQITRRQWLLRLGETVALAGVSGLVPEMPLRWFDAEPQRAGLPPGLYEPSSDDLVHVLGAHKLATPPKGSETDYVQPGVPQELQFFSPSEFRIIRSYVSILLGDVEPGALSETADWVDLWFHSAEGVRQAARDLDPLHRTLAVAYFGEGAVKEIEAADPAAVAREGIKALDKLCLEQHDKAFADLDGSAHQEIVSAIGATPADASPRNFLELVRNESIRGYYTSAAGLKELDYKGNAYYPYCPGCESNAKDKG